MKTKNNWYACYVKSLFLILLWLVLLPPKGFAQEGKITGDGKVTYEAEVGGAVIVEGQTTFTSYVSTDNVADMVQLDAIKLFNQINIPKGTIKAIGPGSITLTIYSFDANSPATDHKGAIIYKLAYENGVQKPTFVTSPFKQTDLIPGENIKQLLYGAKTNLAKQGTVPTNLQKSTLAYIKQQVLVGYDKDNPLIDLIKGNNYLLTQPVIVEVNMKDAKLLELDIPVLSQNFNLGAYFDKKRGGFYVHVLVNGEARYGYWSLSPNEFRTVEAKMGDNITYRVIKVGYILSKPTIEGIPDVWIARFGGDLMYYCSPSVTPGEYTPWIGYDSKVHVLQVRKYPEDFKQKVEPWEFKGQYFEWSLTAKRKMDANVLNFKQDPIYKWQKWQLANADVPDGHIQRNDQREGLNIQLLNYWQGGLRSYFDTYSGDSKYFMGFDSDALLYLNSNHYNSKVNPPPAYPNGGILKLDSLPWRSMPEGKEQIVDVTTGYPTQGFTPGIMVQAYRANREAAAGNTTYNTFKRYDGYEIQDKGTDDTHPNGTGTGNKAAPGVVTIRSGNMVVRFKINVTAPFDDSKGFYGSLTGETWPAYFEKNIPYTLSGLQGLSIAELDKFILEYSGTNSNGEIAGLQTKRLSDVSMPEKQTIQNTGKWTVLLDNEAPVYASVTAYYQRTPTSEKVMIAGKELKPIFLLFFGDKELEGDKGGLGAYTWWQDYREVQDENYVVPKKMGTKINYIKKEVKNYAYPNGTRTTFTAWDGDPHMFMETPEFYLSSRTKAKRITDDYLDGKRNPDIEPYLKFYINGIAQPRTAQNKKDFTHVWDQPGQNVLTVKYRNTNTVLDTLRNNITVTNYPNNDKGRIIRRPLTQMERDILKLNNGISDMFLEVLEVVDVSSKFKYIDGERATPTPPGINRWADFKDYKVQYKWFNPNGTEMRQDDRVRNSISLYLDHPPKWFYDNWCLHYSSNWQGKEENVPYYVNNDGVLRVKSNQLNIYNTYLNDNLFTPTPPAAWQTVMPLVSVTDYQGYRTRYNPSCIYDIPATWNNAKGAFSGKPTLPGANDTLGPIISDYNKNEQELYYKLKGNEMLIIKEGAIPKGSPISLKGFDKNGSQVNIATYTRP